MGSTGQEPNSEWLALDRGANRAVAQRLPACLPVGGALGFGCPAAAAAQRRPEGGEGRRRGLGGGREGTAGGRAATPTLH